MDTVREQLGCKRYAMRCANCGITEAVEHHLFKPDDAGVMPPFVNEWKLVPMNGGPFGRDLWAHSVECARALARREVDRLYGLDPLEVTAGAPV